MRTTPGGFSGRPAHMLLITVASHVGTAVPLRHSGRWAGQSGGCRVASAYEERRPERGWLASPGCVHVSMHGDILGTGWARCCPPCSPAVLGSASAPPRPAPVPCCWGQKPSFPPLF